MLREMKTTSSTEATHLLKHLKQNQSVASAKNPAVIKT
jgi:hypothetical protein